MSDAAQDRTADTPQGSWSRIFLRYLDGKEDELFVPSEWVHHREPFLDVWMSDPFGPSPYGKTRSFPMIWVREIVREDLPEGTEVDRGDGILWSWNGKMGAWLARKPETAGQSV